MAEYTREVEIEPGEVDEISGQLHQLAGQADDIAAQVSTLLRELEGSWQGIAQHAYYQTYERMGQRIQGLAGDLRARARLISAIRVVITIVEKIKQVF